MWQIGGALGPKEAVIPRSCSLYFRFDFTNLAPAQRRAALELAARQGPLPSPGPFACRWQGGVAHAWVPRMPTAIDDGERLVAESSLVPPLAGDGVRLLGLRDGCEGQIWAGGVLQASRWWEEPPSETQWGLFLRASSQSLDTAHPVPALQPVSGLVGPWGEAHERLLWTPAQLETVFWRTFTLLTAMVVGWQMVGVAWWSVARQLQEQRIETLRIESAPLIAAREQAEAARQRMAALLALMDTTSDVQLQADVRRILAPEIRLQGWTRDQSRLRIETAGGGTDPRPVVQAFATHPVLGGVVANPIGEGRMQLVIDLDPEGRP